jgi:hypothetical protein
MRISGVLLFLQMETKIYDRYAYKNKLYLHAEPCSNTVFHQVIKFRCSLLATNLFIYCNPITHRIIRNLSKLTKRAF